MIHFVESRTCLDRGSGFLNRGSAGSSPAGDTTSRARKWRSHAGLRKWALAAVSRPEDVGIPLVPAHVLVQRRTRSRSTPDPRPIDARFARRTPRAEAPRRAVRALSAPMVVSPAEGHSRLSPARGTVRLPTPEVMPVPWLRSRTERSSGITTWAIEWREGGRNGKVRARQLGAVTEEEAQYELAAMNAGKPRAARSASSRPPGPSRTTCATSRPRAAARARSTTTATS